MSPHVKTIRERIRIDCEPITEELFAKHFFDVWEVLPKQSSEFLDIPRYLQLLALTSFHVFIKEGVDVAIYETHFGGEFDATNIIRTPVVTGITTIGMDHVKLLGPSIEDIAWHKAGIMKPRALSFSTVQDSAVTAVLKRRAAEKEVQLKFVDVDSILLSGVRVIRPEVQRNNCSLALSLVTAFLSQKTYGDHINLNPDDIVRGINSFSLPGRFQQITNGKSQWYLDGAHNELSVPYAVQWFTETAEEHCRYTIRSFSTVRPELMLLAVLYLPHGFSSSVIILTEMERSS